MWIANLKYCTCHDRANYKRATTSAQVYETCDLSSKNNFNVSKEHRMTPLPSL